MDDIEEILETVDCARIKALALRDVAGGGAAMRAIWDLADSVEALARLWAADRRVVPDRRAWVRYDGQERRRT